MVNLNAFVGLTKQITFSDLDQQRAIEQVFNLRINGFAERLRRAVEQSTAEPQIRRESISNGSNSNSVALTWNMENSGLTVRTVTPEPATGERQLQIIVRDDVDQHSYTVGQHAILDDNAQISQAVQDLIARIRTVGDVQFPSDGELRLVDQLEPPTARNESTQLDTIAALNEMALGLPIDVSVNDGRPPAVIAEARSIIDSCVQQTDTSQAANGLPFESDALTYYNLALMYAVLGESSLAGRTSAKSTHSAGVFHSNKDAAKKCRAASGRFLNDTRQDPKIGFNLAKIAETCLGKLDPTTQMLWSRVGVISERAGDHRLAAYSFERLVDACQSDELTVLEKVGHMISQARNTRLSGRSQMAADIVNVAIDRLLSSSFEPVSDERRAGLRSIKRDPRVTALIAHADGELALDLIKSGDHRLGFGSSLRLLTDLLSVRKTSDFGVREPALAAIDSTVEILRAFFESDQNESAVAFATAFADTVPILSSNNSDLDPTLIQKPVGNIAETLARHSFVGEATRVLNSAQTLGKDSEPIGRARVRIAMAAASASGAKNALGDYCKQHVEPLKDQAQSIRPYPGEKVPDRTLETLADLDEQIASARKFARVCAIEIRVPAIVRHLGL